MYTAQSASSSGEASAASTTNADVPTPSDSRAAHSARRACASCSVANARSSASEPATEPLESERRRGAHVRVRRCEIALERGSHVGVSSDGAKSRTVEERARALFESTVRGTATKRHGQAHPGERRSRRRARRGTNERRERSFVGAGRERGYRRGGVHLDEQREGRRRASGREYGGRDLGSPRGVRTSEHRLDRRVRSVFVEP
jgi:hypothetical protein